MSKTVQWKRGNTTVNSTYVGAQGEITVNTDNWNLHVHDGLTPGGYVIDSSNGGGSYSNLTVTGNISAGNLNVAYILNTNTLVATGNITAPYFIGNGSLLTGLASYSNANVVAYGQAGWSGNIIPAANAVYTLGNITNQWANLWVADNTIYIGNIALGVNNSNILTINSEPILSNNSNTTIGTTGNITAGNLSAYRITSSFGNITNLVAVDSLDFTNGSEIDGTTGNASLGNILLTGNITSDYFIGNGSLLTGVTSYSNAEVVSYGETGWSGNIIPSTNNTFTLGNITNQWANLWVANNTIYLGNIAIGINDANVLTVNGQPTLSNDSNTTINTDGNLTAGNLIGYRTTSTFGNITNLLGVESLEFTDGSEIDGTTGNASLGNLILSGNITGSNILTIQVPAGGSSKLTNRIDETINSSYSGSWDTAEWINSGGTGIISILNASGSMRRYLELRMAVANPNTATFTINGEPTVYTFNGWNYNQSTGITEIYLAEVPASSPTVVTSLNFSAQVRNIIELNDDDNQLNLQSYSGWPINIRSGYEGDVNINAGDDITIEAGDKTRSDSSGGFIGIYSGKGGDADNDDAGGSGGFLNLYAGYGGDASNDYSAGSGGGLELRAGNGGSAKASASQEAGTGGSLTIAAGQAGNNDGNSALGGVGGDLYLYGGQSTGNGIQGGGILIYAGAGGANAGSGNVVIRTSNNGGMTVPSLIFDNTGNLNLPQGGIVYETNIPDGGLEGYTIALKPSGGTNADQKLLIYPTTTDANHLHLTSGNLYNTELFLGSDDLYVKLANTGNVVVNSNDSVGNSAQWTFGTDGALTLPALSGQIGLAGYTNGIDLYNNTDGTGYVRMNYADESLVWVDVGGSHIETIGGTWDFDTTGNLTAPGNIGTAGNISANYFVGNGSLLTGITAGSNYTNSNVVNLLSNFGSNTIVTTGNITGGNIIGNITITGNVTGTSANVTLVAGAYSTVFDNTGVATFPGNITTSGNVTVNDTLFIVGSIQPFGASPAPSLSGFSSISTVISGNPNEGNITAHNYLIANGGIITSGNITSGNISVGGIVTFADATYQNTAWTGVANTYIALGTGAGGATQSQTAVAIGVNAGNVSQDYYTVAIGIGAGRDTQLAGAVAIGGEAGGNNQGTNSIAIGYRAGRANQANNSIVLNSTGANLNISTANTFVVAPIRNISGNVGVLQYNDGTKEISYSSNITGNLIVNNTLVNSIYLLEAYANVTYTLPGSFTEDPCRYSIISSNVNVSSSWFNTSTYTFTPQQAGYWEITASYDIYRNTEASIAIKKNNSIVAVSGSFDAVVQQITKIIYLNGSTDYINIVNVGGAALSRAQYDSRSWFQARWVGA